MKFIIILAVFVLVVLGGAAYIISSNQSKIMTERAEPKAEKKDTTAKVEPKPVVKQEPKIVAPIKQDSNTVSTNPDINLNKEVTAEIKEIKEAVASVNKELPIIENKKPEPVSVAKEELTTHDFSQMPIEKLNTFLAKGVKENDKIEALNALGEKKLEAKNCLESVLTIMNTGSNLERAYAARAVGNISKDDKGALDQLIAVLKSDKEENVRKEAVRSIGEFAIAKDQVKELEAVMLTETNEQVKAKLKIALFKLNQKE